MNGGTAGLAMMSSVMTDPAGATDRSVTFALTLDRERRPIELTLTATGMIAAGATLPAGVADALRFGGGSQPVTVYGRRWELAARLDLQDPEVAAAWSAFRDHPTDGAAIRALADAVPARAQLDVRTYAVSSRSDGAALGIGAGVRLGGELARIVDRSRLLAAATRPAGGLWEQRSDCVAT
jgi:hypothetical protein